MGIGVRLQSERTRLNLTQEGVASAVEMTKQAIGSYERGVRSPGAELLARLAKMGFDVTYVLTGVRQTPLNEPTEREREVLAGRGVEWGPAEVQVTPLGLCWLLNFRAQEGQGKPLLWGRSLLTALTEFVPRHARAFHLQAVVLQAREKAWPTLMMYLDASPPAVPWALSPLKGVPQRYEFDEGEHDLPLELPDSGFPAPVLRLQPAEVADLLAGKVLSFGRTDAAHTAAARADAAAAPTERPRPSESYKVSVSRSFFGFAVGKIER
ncbi:MAG: helix-turn-helix transcriptional regulator [Burkholderiales bacterium]|nr:helix-turn-helix transcriptional regulator [Burkholderiales bacterium]